MSSKGSSASPETVQHNTLITKTLDFALQNFKLGNYQDSIALYTKGIKFCLSLTEPQIQKIRHSLKLTARPPDLKPKDPLYHPKFATLLDSRAACYIKLGDLRRAEKDARNIVRCEPYSTKGHIRLTKVLEMRGDLKGALEACSKGVKYLQFGKKKYGIQYNQGVILQLQDSVKRLRDLISSSTAAAVVKPVKPPSMDPMEYLPLELIDLILKQLTFAQIMKQCVLVSKTWHAVCSSLSMFDDIRIKPHCTTTDVQNCFASVTRWKNRQHDIMPTLKSLKIGNTGVMDERSIFRLFFHKSQFRVVGTLDLQFNSIGMKDIIEAIDYAQNGEDVLKQVRVLKLQCLFNPRYEEMLLKYLPQLESLMLVPSYDGTTSRLSIPRPYNFENFVTRLKHLSIIGDIKQPYVSVPFHNLFIRDSKQLINLESLQIIGYDFSQLNVINETYNFLQRFPKLRHLVLENNTNLTFKHLLKNHDILRLSRLKTFVFREKEIKYIESLHFFEPTYLANTFSHLSLLDLTNSSISYHALRALLQLTGPSLKQLSIGLCPNLLFKQSGFTPNNPHFVNIPELLTSVPNLLKFHLNQCTGFTDYTLRELTSAVQSTKSLRKLLYLDLSFNDNLQGHTVLDFVSLLPCLKQLVIHGSYLRKETIDYLQAKYGVKVDSLIEKRGWKEYGVNTYDPFNC